MYSWLAPFLVVAAIAVLYFRGGSREAVVKDLNFYMVVVLIVAGLAILANARYGKDWSDYLAWAGAAVGIGAVIWRAKSFAGDGGGTRDKGPLG